MDENYLVGLANMHPVKFSMSVKIQVHFLEAFPWAQEL